MRNRHYKTDSIDNNAALKKHTDEVPDRLRKFGSIRHKIPVRIDAQTVVYVDKGADIEAVRRKYEERNNIYQR